MAIGLFIAAVGTTLLAANLLENRGLLLEARLMQDLRTASDLIARDLRRAGYWGAATSGIAAVGGAPAPANPYAAISPAGSASDAASFRYSRDTVENNLVDNNEQFGFRLRQGAIELQLGAGNWQAMTDTGTLIVTTLRLSPTVSNIDLEAACVTACPVGSSCPLHQQVRRFDVLVSGRSVADAAVVRSVRASVRLRNDVLFGACPT
ncbi:hypothetical protein BH11PSE8_BH11PSE8_17080 [soil metagenome]